jgi:hypothetical protein
VYNVSKIPEKQTAAMPMKKINSAIIARNALSVESLAGVYKRKMRQFTKRQHCWLLHKKPACKRNQQVIMHK